MHLSEAIALYNTMTDGELNKPVPMKYLKFDWLLDAFASFGNVFKK